jgi:cystathionine beta-lyase/cystathionine gamma-synthase
LLGADVVVHSVSKYIGGHSDVIMGTTTTNNTEYHDGLFLAAKSFGGNPSPFDCYTALKGLKTLEARMKIHSYNAFCLAHFLSDHPHVVKTNYPGLKSHPQYETVLK